MNTSAELGRIAASIEATASRTGCPGVLPMLEWAASLRAVAAGIESATAGDGWTEVTDDPATWPKPFGALVLYDVNGGNSRTCRHAGTEAMHADIRNALRTSRVIRWMPWPSALRAAATGGEEA
jgi:hypothetical protein